MSEPTSVGAVVYASGLGCEATYLHAALQGLEIVLDEIRADPQPATNAIPALMEDLLARANRLLTGIETLEKHRD